jgi:hypothetical protein
LKKALKETAQTFKRETRQLFIAQVFLELEVVGQAKARQLLVWNPRPIGKEIKQVTSNITQIYNYQARKRKKAEYHLLKLLEKLKNLKQVVQLINPNAIARE